MKSKQILHIPLKIFLFLALICPASFASGGVGNYSSNYSPCDDGNTCHHECELEKLSNETSVWYNVWCHCFEGFEFTGKISSEGFELCMPMCNPGFYWESKDNACIEVLSECQDHLHDDAKVQDDSKELPNIELIGRGYDLIIGDPYAKISDPGLLSPIFSPFAKVKGSNVCYLHGYDIDGRGSASCSNEAKTFKSSKKIYEDFESFVSEANTFEEGTIRVTDTSSARSSVDISNQQGTTTSMDSGTSSSENMNYGLGGGNVKNKEGGWDVGTSANKDSNDCSTTSRTRDETFSSERSQSKQMSQSNTMSKSQSDTLERSSSSGSEDCTSSSTTTSVSGTAGFSGFGVQASVTAGVDNTSGKNNCKTTNTGTVSTGTTDQSNENTVGFEASNSNSATQSIGSQNTNSNENCKTQGRSNSVSKRMSSGSSSTSDWKIDQSSNIGRTSNLNEQVQASRTDTIGSSKEKGRNLEYEIQGFKQSFVGTRSFLNSETLIKSASGSVSVSNSVARQYGAKMKEDRPAFTTDFVKEIQFLNAKSLLVGEFDGGIETKVTEDFDELFVKFIKKYGTHFPTEVEMGSRRFSQMRFNEEETQRLSDESRESCVESLINDGKSGTKGETCKVPTRGSVQIDNESISRSIKAAYGSTRIGQSCEDWFHHLVPDKSVRIKTKLQPITSLFTEKFMPRSRITMEDGSEIDVKKISGWFLLRYLNMCRFVGKIYADKSDPSNIKAECRKRENSCSLWSECGPKDACVIDAEQEKGYRCVADPCARSDCVGRAFQKCTPDGNAPNYHRCENKDFCLKNPCEATENCITDFTSREGYVCKNKCGPRSCGEFENCIHDETTVLGYKCEDIDMCAQNPCQLHELCQNDKYRANGYMCTDVCLTNPCNKWSDCVHDHSNAQGYECIEPCDKDPCKQDVETCFVDINPNGIGYYCYYDGCPTDKNLCEYESNGAICRNDQFSTLGYQCINPCEDNPCKKHVETCLPDSDPYGPGYYCSWNGCPNDYNVCDFDGYPEGFKCEEDQYGDYGYTCTDPCEYNSCREHVETCRPSQYDQNGYRCEYTGCPYYDICYGQQCQEDVNSVIGYKCKDPCESNNCRDYVEVCEASPNEDSGYFCRFTGCPKYPVCSRGHNCVADDWSFDGYTCEPK